MTSVATAEAAGPSLLARAVGIITSPAATFRSVVASPRPAGILLLVCLVVGLATSGPLMTERGRQAALDAQVQQIESLTKRPVEPQAYAQLERMSYYSRYLALVGPFVAIPVVALLVAAVCWFIFNTILGGAAGLKPVLAVVTHSMVISALGELVAAPIQYFQEVRTAAGPFNLGALAPMLESGSFGASFLGAISAFRLWQIVVLGIGLAVLYRRKAGPLSALLVSAYLAAIAVFTLVITSLAGRQPS